MRIAEYKQIDTEREIRSRVVQINTTDGETVGERIEQYEVEVPIMGMVYRDATAEEIAEAERMAAEMPTEPVDETAQRIADLEDALIELASILMDG